MSYQIDNIVYPVYGKDNIARYNGLVEYFYRLFNMKNKIKPGFNYYKNSFLALKLEREVMEYLTYEFNRKLSKITEKKEKEYIVKLSKVYEQLTSDKTSCNISWLSTSSGGMDYWVNTLSFEPLDLILFAYNLTLDYKQKLTSLCRLIHTDFPSLKWEEKSYFGNPRITSREEKRAISDYIDYGYSRMNDELRYYPDDRAILNEVINRLPPLSKDIVVYRFSGDVSEWLDKNKDFEIHGYLSTSLKPSKAFWATDRKDWGVMVIKVPTGKKGIYIGGREAEIIFPHKSKFRYIRSEYKNIVFIDKSSYEKEKFRKLNNDDEMYYLTEKYPDERIRIANNPTEIIYLEMI